MGMFQKVNSWLTDKGEKFARGGDANRIPGNAYYASNEAEQAYGGMRKPAQDNPIPPDSRTAGSETARSATLDRFSGDASDKYAGRVPYRSQKDMQAEADTQRQQLEEQQRRQQTASQRQQAQQFGRAPAQPAYQQHQQSQQPQQPNNVLPFPGMIRGPEGNLYAHVEYVVLLRSRNECTKVIEYIKANASVFLNMEFIANDSERQRCVDMLSGAAYTLGCTLSKISQRGIYLISSPSVYVVIDPAMQKYATAPEAQGYVRPEYASPSAYGAGSQSAAYGAQQGGYATGARTAAYAARQNATYGAGAQTAAYAAQPAATYGAGAQTGAYAAQPAAGYATAARPAAYASQPAGGYTAGAQTAPFASQRTGAYAANPAAPFNAAAPTGGYAPVQQAAPVTARRAGAPFGMQGAFVKSADGTQGR